MMPKPFLYAAALAAALLLGGCEDAPPAETAAAPAAEQSNSARPDQTDRPNFVVLTLPAYPPFATRNTSGGMTGLDIDLLNAIAERENFTLTFLPHPAKGLFDVLDNGQADIIASGLHITPERSEKYDFSKPYLESSWAVLVDGSKHKPKSFAELRGKPIAAQQSTTSESQLKSLNLTDKIVPVQTIYLGKAQMEQGNAVAVYDVESVLKTYVRPGSKYYLLPDDKSAKIQTAFAIVKGNTMLKTKIDRGLDKIHADGTYQKILQHWQQNNGSNTDLPAASAAETP